ncbi:hypothetical protein [Mesorhizobium sp.]|uniref:hypothetical protein n=1 Tax=Mesorhizobium sp. TaxID=1871066 RepID=UPI0025C05526|nr:hypothetical protein [Mesorhizobium sp.]
MMVDMRQHDAIAGLMHDDAQITVDADGPEIGVARLVDAMELKARPVRVRHQLERCKLSLLALLIGELAERRLEVS